MLILASASPPRRELLTVLVSDFRVRPADVDERVIEGEDPEEYALRVARAKALAGTSKTASSEPDHWVLGADTAVVVDGQCLGKPADAQDARAMLESLSGRTHRVVSAVVLAGPGVRADSAVCVSRVNFDPLPAAWIEDYIATGEPMDKAGAYAIQGRAAAWISRLEGSYSGVVGLPLYETAGLLRKAGF